MYKFSNQIKELISMDQDNILLFRHGNISQEELIKRSKKISVEFLEIIKQNGFPYRDIVAEDVYKNAVTLSLHLDISDMNYIFDTFLKNVANDKFANEHKAIFIDKIRVLSGKPQLYGTQYKIDKEKNIDLLPIEDIENLEIRRKKMGLLPLSEYLKIAKGLN